MNKKNRHHFSVLTELKYVKTCFKNALFANETKETAKKQYFSRVNTGDVSKKILCA
jgi:hypothetical protein